jgi:GNAT superfamily N-acetyltransferase
VNQVEIRPTRFGAPVATALMTAALADLSARYGGEGDGTPVVPMEFAPPEGGFLVAYVNGTAAGCGGWRTLPGDERVAEVKRMFVLPEYRGNGVATAVLRALEDSARAAGKVRVVLETGDRQPEAIALYQKCGYAVIPNFGYYRNHAGCVSLGRDV